MVYGCMIISIGRNGIVWLLRRVGTSMVVEFEARLFLHIAC